ncbi:MAG: family 78 glycoside hydrolase catalytic domain [Clostridia bacterium]|nr:family 78 glycoside hydrolase catalytic domain [Clostridia bacterium]
MFDSRTKWLTAQEFSKCEAVNVFHRESEGNVQPSDASRNNFHMYARRAFRLSSRIRSAEIRITADDYYKLYINGAYVAQGPAPGYPDRYYVNRLDVMKYLRAGDNVIAVDVYYQGLVNRVWVSGDMRQGFMMELIVDGKTAVRSDERFHYMKSASYTTKDTFGYETQYSEHFDSREEPVGWKDVGFDDFMWTACAVKPKTDYKLMWQETPVLDTEMITPEILLKEGKRTLYDFGREISGVICARAKGREGSVVTLHMGEELTGEGTFVRYQTRANCRYEDTWTLSGKTDEWEMYDYRGFRYLEVIGDDDTEILEIAARSQHYPLDEDACVLETTDHKLQKIFELCKNTIKTGVQEGFLDCPTREKGQYSGDLVITSLTHLYISGDVRLLKKALEDWMHSAFITKGLMAVFPCAFMQEIADYTLEFPLVAVRYYEHTGDRELLKEAYKACLGIYETYRKYERADGLIENVTEAWNLVDWPKNLRDDYDFPLEKPVGPGCHNVINAFYIGFVGGTEKIASILGEKFEARFSKLASAYEKAFYRPDQGLYADSENSSHFAVHSNILPLFYGMVSKDKEEKIAGWLIESGMKTGVYMAFFLLKALARAGKYEEVYKLITSEGEHSWMNMLDEGATTLFEAWGKDQKWNTSLCHPWASAPVSVLIEDVLGITPDVIDGGVWRCHLPKSVETLKMTVPVKGVNAVFLRDEGATTLTIEKKG